MPMRARLMTNQIMIFLLRSGDTGVAHGATTRRGSYPAARAANPASPVGAVLSGPDVEDELLVVAGEHVAQPADLGGHADVEVEGPVVLEPPVEERHHLAVGPTVVARQEAD